MLLLERTPLRGAAPCRDGVPDPPPDRTLELPTHTRACPACAGPLWSAATARRTVVTLEGLVRLRLQVRSCRNPDCPRHKACLRPEQEGRFALPQHEFGLDVIAAVGRLRHAEHRSVPEIHAELARRGVPDLCPQRQQPAGPL